MNEVYSDGGVIGHNPSSDGGTWAFVVVSDGTVVNKASGLMLSKPYLGYPEITNNMSELMALTKALESLPDGWSGNVCCDSKVALGWVFWGWKTTMALHSLIRRCDIAKSRLGTLNTVLLDGHPTKLQLTQKIGKRGNPCSEFNVMCDKMCNAESREFREVIGLK